MKNSTLPLLLLLVGAAACGASNATTEAKSPAAVSEGSTAAQAKGDDAARALTEEECKELGQSIEDNCHGQNTRSAELQGWCSDKITGIGSGSWLADCTKHVKYMDAVCITSNPSIRAMMDCDRAVSR